MNVFMLGLVSGLMLWPVVGSAELYKWTDDQGTLHITDTLPVTKKKSPAMATPVPRSASPKKAAGRPTLPGRPQAEIHPVPDLSAPSLAREEVPTQQALEGLSPSQATRTSSWQVFDGAQMNAKAPVLRWKDEKGIDHFVDVLPPILSGSEAAPQSENVSLSRPNPRATGRPTGVSRSRYSY